MKRNDLGDHTDVDDEEDADIIDDDSKNRCGSKDDGWNNYTYIVFMAMMITIFITIMMYL